MGIYLGASDALTFVLPLGPSSKTLSLASPAPCRAAAGSSEPSIVLSLGCTTPVLSASHRGLKQSGLRDITAGGTGTGMVVSHHTKEEQPPSLCSCDDSKRECWSSLSAVPTQRVSCWHPALCTQPPWGISALAGRKPVYRKLCSCLWPRTHFLGHLEVRLAFGL